MSLFRLVKRLNHSRRCCMLLLASHLSDKLGVFFLLQLPNLRDQLLKQ